jgi:hypothetical protein
MALAQITCTTVNIGTAPVITISFTGMATKWDLTYEFGSHSGTIAVNSTAKRFADYVWPTTFYNEIPNELFGVGVLYLDCYKDDEYLGREACVFKVLVNKSASAPTISFPTITDTNSKATDLTGSVSKFIRYISTAAVSLTATARNGATIRSVRVTNNGRGAEVTTGNVSVTIPNVESNKFVVVATDSRGITTSVTYALEAEDLIPYVKLTCNAGNEQPDTDGNIRLTCSGNYYDGAFSAYSGNMLDVRYRYKEQGGEFGAWQFMNVDSVGDGKYSAYISLSGLDYRKTYVFECQAGDEFMTVTSAGKTAQALPVFHWSDDDFVFEVPVTFKQGAAGIVGGDGDIDAGTWTPTLTTAAAVSSYSTRSGWYMRVGNVVTIGFNINASCKSGYSSTALAISGLPFTPAENAFGGGVMFGAYVNAGFCFEAWAATTSGQITPRLQPCNNTSASNLQISSTAYYPSGTNSITLGGTITYMTT